LFDAILPLLLAGLLYSCSAGETGQKKQGRNVASPTPTGVQMRIESKEFSFAVPPGFNDETNYAFKDRDERELLTVIYGRATPTTPTLESVIADRLGDMKDVLGGEMRIEQQSAASLAGVPARRASFTFEDRGTLFREQWVFAMLREPDYVHIAYVAPANDPQSALKFEHIISSVSPSGASTSPQATGFERRQAGQIWLDVPTTLAFPSVYLIVSPGERVRLTLSVYNPRTSREPLRTLDEEIASDTQSGARVSHQREVRINSAAGSGIAVHYLLSGDDASGVEQQKIIRGRINLENGTILSLSGRANISSTTDLDASFDMVASSITRK
jgi:hypothetical protein